MTFTHCHTQLFCLKILNMSIYIFMSVQNVDKTIEITIGESEIRLSEHDL